jgi:hypothetical protein
MQRLLIASLSTLMLAPATPAYAQNIATTNPSINSN